MQKRGWIILLATIIGCGGGQQALSEPTTAAAQPQTAQNETPPPGTASGEGSPAATGANVAAPSDAALRDQDVRNVIEVGNVVRVRVPVSPSDITRGNPDAQVTIVAFSDFQCPFCGRAVPTLQEIFNRYPGKVRLVWKDLPLPFHQRARAAANVAHEAFAQSGTTAFWQMHDLLFQNQRALEDADLLSYAQTLGLDMTRTRQAITSLSHEPTIAMNEALAQSLGVNGTPQFFINGRSIVGAQGVDAFTVIIDDEIDRANRIAGRTTRFYDAFMLNALDRVPEDMPPPSAAPTARRAGEPDPSVVYRVPVDGAPSRGPRNALVTMVIFSDFQCPFCGRVVHTVADLLRAYPSDLRIVFRHNPLSFHDNARPAALASLEVFAQRGDTGFWRFHDRAFANQQDLAGPDLERYAREAGANLPRFRTAIDANAHDARLAEDMALAQRLSATGTPSFFVNGRVIRGARPIETFRTLIDSELAAARALVASGTPRNRIYETIMRSAVERAGPTPSE